MTSKVTTWVWHADATENLTHRDLVVLLALADIADDDGNVRFAKKKPGGRRRNELTAEEQERLGDQLALAKKARMSVPTFRRATTLLQEIGLLEVTRATPTSVNEYRVVMTAQPDLWIANDPQINMSARTAQSYERSHRSTVSGHRDVLNVDDSSRSSTDVTTVARGPAEPMTTERDLRQVAEPMPRRRFLGGLFASEEQLDRKELSRAIRTHFPELVDERTLDDVVDDFAEEILRKGRRLGRKVAHPTAYVVSVLTTDPEWHQRVYESFGPRKDEHVAAF